MTRREFDKWLKEDSQRRYIESCLAEGHLPEDWIFDPEPDDPPPSEGSDYILTRKDLQEYVPVNRTTLWRMVRKGRFPAPLRVAGTRLQGWRLSTVQAWIKNQS
jgi:predicted DNA-binding transcriptional regulator AlpA